MSQHEPAGQRAANPTAARALAYLLQLNGLVADAAEILHRNGNAPLDESDMLRALAAFPVKARFVRSSLAKLAGTPMPGLAQLDDGRWIVIGAINQGKILIQDTEAERPEAMMLEDFERRWTGRLMLMTRRAGLGDIYSQFGVDWFLSAVRKYKNPLFEVLGGSFFLQLFGLMTPLFFQVIIDKVFVQRGLSTLEILAIGWLAVSLFEVVLGGIRNWLLAHTSNRIDVELGARLFRHLVALPFAYFQARRVGDTVARVRELETIRQFLTSSSLTLVIDLFFATLFLIVLFIYSPLLTVIVAAALPLYVLLSFAVTPAFRERLNEKFKRGATNQAFLVETVSGIETVKSMALEPVLQRRWEEQLAGYVQASFRVVTLSTFASQAAALINKVTIILIIFFGAQLVIDNKLTIGELVAFNMIASQLSGPVLRLAQLWQDFQQFRLSIDRLGDILNTRPEPNTAAQANLPMIRGDIRFDDVSFRYRIDGAPVLQNVSLDIPAGQVIGIAGPSGSGKSTLAKLVQRLYVPERGRVFIDGADLALADPAWLRRQVGVVLQENVLFNTTVRENIAIREPGLPMERIIEAAQLAGAHDFIISLPEGYDTVIGERGASLSGGQRQRVAIARALLGDPRILVFDEATSALDYESEAIIQRNMRGICQGRTVILIAHRLSTLRGVDRIITIDQGAVIEDGDHDSLLRKGGRYADLWRLQSGDVRSAAR